MPKTSNSLFLRLRRMLRNIISSGLVGRRSWTKCVRLYTGKGARSWPNVVAALPSPVADIVAEQRLQLEQQLDLGGATRSVSFNTVEPFKFKLAIFN